MTERLGGRPIVTAATTEVRMPWLEVPDVHPDG
jgi:hypothetical protein